MAQFGRVEYWDERYKTSPNESHEWYQNYKSLRHLLNPIHFAAQGNGVRAWNRRTTTPVTFPPRDACRVLILGCGNSQFGQDMRNDGWTGPMMNLDYSQVVIEQMKERYGASESSPDEKKPAMEFMCHDVTTGLPFADESFDLIVCKGVFDAVLCSTGSVAHIRTLVQESVRCLVRGQGVFFIVTHANPDNRLEYLEHENDINHYWDGVSVHTMKRQESGQAPKTDYLYICRRRLHPLPTAPAAAAGGKENQENAVAATSQQQKKKTAMLKEQPASS